MAPFRKSSPKSRGALQASTALPTTTADLVGLGGEQAAHLTEEALTVAGKLAPAVPKRGGRTPESEALEAPTPLPGDLPATMGLAAEPRAAIEAEGPVDDEAQAGANAASIIDEASVETAAAASSVMAAAERSVPDAERTIELADAQSSEASAAASAEAQHAAKALDDISASVAEAFRATIEQTMSHWVALMKVRSVPEAITLNTEHLHRRMEAYASQTRQFTVLAQRLAVDAIAALRPDHGR